MLGLVISMALGLRLARLTYQPLWWDEGWSLYFATSDVRTMLDLTAVDIHPPLYYLLLHVWTGILGSGVVSVRLLSVLIGTATVPLLYLAARRLFGERGGLLAAFLLAVSPFHVYYSQEVRMYGLVTLLGLAAFACVLRWRPGCREPGAEEPGPGVWWGYVLAATAALYTQYYAAFLLLALNVIALVHWLRSSSPAGRYRRSTRAFLPWLSAQAVVALLYLPWLWYAGDKLLSYVRFKVSADRDLPVNLFTYLGRHLAAFGWGHAEGLLADWWWLGLLPFVVLLTALVCLWRPGCRQGKRGRPPAGIRDSLSLVRRSPGVVLVALVGCGFAVNRIFPFNPARGERLLLLALPACLLLFTSGLLALWRRHRALATLAAGSYLILGTVSLGFFYAAPRYADDDYRPLAAQVRALGLPGDAVICVHPWQAGYFRAYLPDDTARPTLLLTPRQVIPYERQLWADDPERMAADLDKLLAEHGRVWLLDHRAMSRFLEAPIETYLAGHAYPVLSEWYGSHTVLSFFATGQPLPQPVSARFDRWLALDGVALSPGSLESGWGVVTADLTWQVSQVPAEDYTVGLRLVGPTGHIWAQHDASFAGGLEQCTEWSVGMPHLDRRGLLVPAGTPPGDYQVTLRVYRSQDVAVLPVTFAGGSGGELVLGTVHIVRPKAAPSVEALTFERAWGVDFGRLRLLGSTVPGTAGLLPGEAVQVELFWQALADPSQDLLPRLQLVDGSGTVVAEATEKPVAGTYPTAWWQSGELVRDPHALPVPAAVTAGEYRLALSLIRAADGSLVEFRRGQTTVDLAEIYVTGREHQFEPTSSQHDQVARLGSSVELAGYDLEVAGLVPGSSLQVTLHWHALETPDKNYHTFVHLLDASGDTVAQHDGLPGEGKLPPLGWLPGEYLADSHTIDLPFDLVAGEYRLAVGLYDPVSDERLGGQVLLDTPVRVSAGP